MNIQRWRRIERLFHEASDLPPAGRLPFLETACRSDPRLRAEVWRLLEFDQRPDIIDTPVLLRHRRGSTPGAADAIDPPTGTTIGPYRLVERVAAGGMGVVYRAVRTDELLDFEVALKLVRRGGESRAIVRRFEEERQTLAHLAHPNIAHLLDGGTTEDGRPYLVMEFIRGSPIDRYCDERRLSIDRRIEIFRVVCGAVHFAHQNLVVHCDLKPANILVTRDGTPRVIDFGVARVLNPWARGRAAATPHDALGTPGYSSPEQLSGGPVTTAADVYGLGAVLSCLLASRGPVSRESVPRSPRRTLELADAALAGRIAADRGTTPTGLRRRLRGDLDAIVTTALNPEPSRRYASAAQLARDLERYDAGRPVTARRDTRRYRLAKFVHRHRAGVLLATMTTLALSAAVVTITRGTIAAVRQRDAARTAEVHANDLAEHAAVEAESARAFVDFLVAACLRSETTGLADPRVVRRRSREEADRVRRDLRDQPHLQANILDALAQALVGFGLYEESGLLGLEALEIRRRQFGDDSLEVALSLRSLGRLATARGDHDAAIDLFRRALAIHRAAPGVHRDVPMAAADLEDALAAAAAAAVVPAATPPGSS